MLVQEFVERQLDGFPEPFYDSLPTVCLEDVCGYPTEMLESLTQLRCSNPRCPSKVVQRMSAMVNRLGVKDFGEERIRAFVSEWGIANPLILFAYEPSDGQLASNISMDLSTKIHNQIKDKKDFTLSEYVRIANLPYIQTSAGYIFDKFDDIREAYKAVEEGGIDYIQNCLGVKKASEPSLMAIKVYTSLMTYKHDLIDLVDHVHIIERNKGDMLNYKVCVSGDVDCGFKTKTEFYRAVNSLSDKLHVDFLGSATKEIKYLVWAGNRITNKVVSVQKRIASGEDIKILNASEFITEMKEKLEVL